MGTWWILNDISDVLLYTIVVYTYTLPEVYNYTDTQVVFLKNIKFDSTVVLFLCAAWRSLSL